MVPSKVLVPVDGSPASLRALDFAIEMMGQHSDTSLVLLNVQNISAMELTGAAMGGDWQEAASQASAKALKEATLLPDRWWRGFWLGWVWVTPLIAMIGRVYLTIPWFRQ